jgi:hypothetical protein
MVIFKSSMQRKVAARAQRWHRFERQLLASDVVSGAAAPCRAQQVHDERCRDRAGRNEVAPRSNSASRLYAPSRYASPPFCLEAQANRTQPNSARTPHCKIVRQRISGSARSSRKC